MQGVFVGVSGGGGAGGSMSTVSREDNAVMSSEDSYSPDEGELELGLGLSLGCGFKGQQQQQPSINGRYARFLTAKDLPSAISAAAAAAAASGSSSSSTSSGSSTLSRAHSTVGTKRSADSVSAPNGASGQVVGWPPIRAYRMNSMVNQAKSLATDEYNLIIGKNKGDNTPAEKNNSGSNMNNKNPKGRTSLFVKVNMDGIAIGRKVDLNAHSSYENLARTLEDMFLQPPITSNTIRSNIPELNIIADGMRCPNLLDGSSDFVLTYKDKEGDWMLVGDVPWGMFLGSVKRLRITRTSEATGLGKQT